MTTKIKALPDNDLRLLLEHYDTHYSNIPHEFEHQVILMFMAYCGLRVGETVQLIDDDVFLCGEPNVSVRIRPEISKNKKGRTVPIPASLRRILSFWHPVNSTKKSSPSGYLFEGRGRPGSHLSVRAVQIYLKHHSRLALGYSVTPHQLRHTFATRMMRVTSSRIVQELLGHTNLSSTQIYMNPTNQDLIDASNKLFPPIKKD